jgi:hypothetical protein
MSGLAEALRANDLDAAMDAIPWSKLERLQHEITPELRSVLNKSGAAAAKQLGMQGIKLNFDQTNPEAVTWITQHAGELVTQNVLPLSRQAIRAIIQKSFEAGIPPASAARMIRKEIGLLPRHVDAVLKYRNRLLKEYELEEAERRAQKYAQKLLNWRAKNIARTETIRALNVGQQQLWQQAIDKGLMRENEWEREWFASDACAICTDLDGTRAPLNAPFEGGYFMPPDPHPSCRCAVGLVRKAD